MEPRALIHRITEELKKGRGAGSITHDLAREGFSETEVKEAMRYSMEPVQTGHLSSRRALGIRMSLWVKSVLAVFAAGGFLFAGTLFLSSFSDAHRYGGFSLPTIPGASKAPLTYGAQPVLAQQGFFNTVRNEFIIKKADFISADLAAMRLSLYKGGVLIKEVPILTKGKEGSWWETPAGLYKIESKEEEHFSSFGRVYQPWSMAFQGNFFIHGWPHYPDGTPVSSTYSGGCIRLSNADAQAIFKEVSPGMPVLVFERDFASDDKTFSRHTPTPSAQRYLAADLGSNFVFLERGSQEPVPIASITKLITALVATEYINLDTDVIITPEMVVPTSKPRLTGGMTTTPYELLFPLLMESSNEAAEALARFSDRDRFVSLMNKKATAIGMGETQFVDPAGSGEGNVATAEDLFTLAKYILNNRSFLFRVSAGKLTVSAYKPPQFSDLRSFNDFAESPSFVGGKVGKTSAAKETGLYVFNVPFATTTRQVAIVILGSEDRKKDAELMLDFIRNNFE